MRCSSAASRQHVRNERDTPTKSPPVLTHRAQCASRNPRAGRDIGSGLFNDGASGPAIFLALADVLKKTSPNVGVDLLLVDGEDYGDFSTNTDVLLGSTYFAKHLPSADYRPLYGVLWDMVGDRDLEISREP